MGSIAYKLQLLSPHVAITEAPVPRTCAPQQDRPPQWEAWAVQWRLAATREKPRCSNEDSV